MSIPEINNENKINSEFEDDSEDGWTGEDCIQETRKQNPLAFFDGLDEEDDEGAKKNNEPFEGMDEDKHTIHINEDNNENQINF